MDDSINPWTHQPYSEKYKKILSTRRTLPVWEQKDDFLRILDENRTSIARSACCLGSPTRH